MSVEEKDYALIYKLADIEQLPPQELHSLFRQAVNELRDLKLEFEEFQCKYPTHSNVDSSY